MANREPKIIGPENKPSPSLQLVRLYHGWTRPALMSYWATCLRSGKWKSGTSRWLFDPSVYTGATSRRHQGLFNPYGVLCHALKCPSQLEPTRDGARMAFADPGDIDFQVDTLPPILHRFLVPMGQSALRVNYDNLEELSRGLFKRVCKETKLSAVDIHRMRPTISTLHRHGASFHLLAILIDANLYHEAEYVFEPANFGSRNAQVSGTA